MGYIEKLLAGVEVAWLPVAELLDLKNGYTPSKSKKEFWENGTIPWFRMDDIRQNGRILDNSLQKITETAVRGGKLFPANSIIVATTATIGEHALITVPYLANQQFTNLSVKEKYAENLDIKYFYYYSFLLADWCKKNTTMSSFASVDMEGLRRFQIPVPCPDNQEKSLAIQSEIVRILDAFTELTAELTAELAARKKQYAYYRDQLLTFADGEVEWKPLGHVTLPTSNIKWRDTDRTYRYIDLTSVSIEIKKIIGTSKINFKNAPSRAQKIVENDDVIFATTRPTQQRCCLVDNKHSGEIASTGYCVLRAKKERVLPKWILYWISSTSFKNYVQDQQSGAAYPAISDRKVKAFLIPIPYPESPKKSLAEQARIVSILDKFSTLTNSMQAGLPYEIELRKKQYQYYRDQLLNFPKPEAG